jgi:hypothetical protein
MRPVAWWRTTAGTEIWHRHYHVPGTLTWATPTPSICVPLKVRSHMNRTTWREVPREDYSTLSENFRTSTRGISKRFDRIVQFIALASLDAVPIFEDWTGPAHLFYSNLSAGARCLLNLCKILVVQCRSLMFTVFLQLRLKACLGGRLTRMFRLAYFKDRSRCKVDEKSRGQKFQGL